MANLSQEEFFRVQEVPVSDPVSDPVIPSVPVESGQSVSQEQFFGTNVQPPQAPQDTRTPAQAQFDEEFGVDQTIPRRGILMPFSRNAAGEREFTVPQVVLDVARGFALPGQIAKGVPFTEDDATNFAFEFAGAAALKGLTKKFIPAPKPKAAKFTKEQLSDIPTSQQLTISAGKKFEKAKQSGSKVNENDFINFMAKSELSLIEEGADRVLHPKLTQIFKVMTDRVGQGDIDITKLMTMRKQIGAVAISNEPDEARIGRILRDNFDEFVEELPGNEIWMKARSQYVQARKVDTIEEVILKADLAASGFENGLRQGFKSLANNKKALRNFTVDEKEAIRKLAKGDRAGNILKKVSKIGFGRGTQTNILGGAAGVAGGGAVGGTTGAILLPIIGGQASRIAETRTLRAANIIKAMAAGVIPTEQQIAKGTRPTRREAIGPAAATAAGISAVQAAPGRSQIPDGTTAIDPQSGHPVMWSAERQVWEDLV